MNERDKCRPLCPWLNSSHISAKKKEPLHEDLSCGTNSCLFSNSLSTSLAIQCGMSIFHNGLTPSNQNKEVIIKHKALLSECLNLIQIYGVHPLDLFSHPSPKTILQYERRNGTLPKPTLLPFIHPQATHEQIKLKPIKTSAQIRESVVPLYTAKNYHELNEERLIGLWIWDQMKLKHKGKKTTFIRTVEKLSREDWFSYTETGRRLSEAENTAPDQHKERIDRIREWYHLTDKCIAEGTILPLSAVVKKG